MAPSRLLQPPPQKNGIGIYKQGGGGMRWTGFSKNAEKCEGNAENAAKNAIENAVSLERYKPPKTPRFVKTHVDGLTPSLHQCEDYGPSSTCKA